MLYNNRYKEGGNAMYYLNERTPMLQFQEVRNDKFYVDKSLLIEQIITKIRTTQKI